MRLILNYLKNKMTEKTDLCVLYTTFSIAFNKRLYNIIESGEKEKKTCFSGFIFVLSLHFVKWSVPFYSKSFAYMFNTERQVVQGTLQPFLQPDLILMMFGRQTLSWGFLCV